MTETTVAPHGTSDGGAGPAAEADRGYAFLAQVLACQLAALSDDPAAAGRAAGAAWGRHLVARPAQSPPLERRETLHLVLELLTRFGVAPEQGDAGGEHLLMRHCPFGEAAPEEVLCTIHLGIVRGALEELGGNMELRDLLPFVEPDLCVARLHDAAHPALTTTSRGLLDV